MTGGEGVAVRADYLCNVIEMDGYLRKQQELEELIKSEIERQYGNESECALENPIIRLCAEFEALPENSQYLLYAFAEKVVTKNDGDYDLKERFWNLLAKGRKEEIWDSIEKFAVSLLKKEYC